MKREEGVPRTAMIQPASIAASGVAYPSPSLTASKDSSATDRRSALSATELDLVTRARSGDQKALRDFYFEYQPQVRGHLHRLLGQDAEVDDLVQNVFSHAFVALANFKGESSVSTWLYRITANTTHNVLRKRFRMARIKTAFQIFDISRGGSNVRASRVEARDEAQRLLLQLQPNLREVFVLYHYEGLTLQEIAQVLGCPISTIGDRLTRARQYLRELVEEA